MPGENRTFSRASILFRPLGARDMLAESRA